MQKYQTRPVRRTIDTEITKVKRGREITQEQCFQLDMRHAFNTQTVTVTPQADTEINKDETYRDYKGFRLERHQTTDGNNTSY